MDNDGDVDVLVWGSKGPFPPNDIGLLLNDGNGIFIFNKEIIKVNNNRISDSFQSLAHRMIDLNNDGCVDIIAGDFFDEDWISDLGLYYPAIYWGNCTGEFVFDINTTENTTILPNKMVDNLDENYNYNVLGQNFIDYDYDGDLDIITSIAENTGTGYYLQLLENLGNKSFADRTSELIQDNYGSGTFYRTRIYDVDNDGDFDIIPWHRDDLTRNIFWENIGGQFVKK